MLFQLKVVSPPHTFSAAIPINIGSIPLKETNLTTWTYKGAFIHSNVFQVKLAQYNLVIGSLDPNVGNRIVRVFVLSATFAEMQPLRRHERHAVCAMAASAPLSASVRNDHCCYVRERDDEPRKADGSPFWPKYRFFHQTPPQLRTSDVQPLEFDPGRRPRRSMFMCRTIRLRSHEWEDLEDAC